MVVFDTSLFSHEFYDLRSSIEQHSKVGGNNTTHFHHMYCFKTLTYKMCIVAKAYIKKSKLLHAPGFYKPFKLSMVASILIVLLLLEDAKIFNYDLAFVGDDHP